MFGWPANFDIVTVEFAIVQLDVGWGICWKKRSVKIHYKQVCVKCVQYSRKSSPKRTGLLRLRHLKRRISTKNKYENVHVFSKTLRHWNVYLHTYEYSCWPELPFLLEFFLQMAQEDFLFLFKNKVRDKFKTYENQNSCKC